MFAGVSSSLPGVQDVGRIRKFLIRSTRDNVAVAAATASSTGHQDHDIDAAQAHRILEAGHVQGKVVLRA